MINNTIVILILTIGLFLNLYLQGQNEPTEETALAEAFRETSEIGSESSVKEVEPVVVGREKWSDKPNVSVFNNDSTKPANLNTRITELDALETKEVKPQIDNLPMTTPRVEPAVHVDRNFEGMLVLKPRKLGFENLFPYQLENSRGKRLAYLDLENLKVIDPSILNGKKVSVLGRLETTKEDSGELVIRARLLRAID